LNTSRRFFSVWGIAAIAMVSKATDATALVLTGAPGDKWTYNVTARFESAGITSKPMSFQVYHSVIAPSGSSLIFVKEDNNHAGAKSSRPVTLAYNPDGTVHHIVGDGVTSAAYRLAYLQTIKFPAKAISTGMEWSWRGKTVTEDGSTVVTVCRYRAAGEEVVKGFGAWRIEIDSHETADGVVPGFPLATLSGTAWIRKSDGRLLGITDVGSHLPVPGKDSSVTVEMKQTSEFVPELEHFAKPKTQTDVPPPAL